MICKGFAWPGPVPFVENYPFSMHGLRQLAKVVTWEASTTGVLRSTNPRCEGFVAKDEGSTCASCAALRTNAFLGGVVARASQEDLHLTAMSNQYMTGTQQQARLRHHAQSECLYRLMVYKGDMKVSRLLRRIDTYKRIILAISANKIPRVHALLRA